MSKKDICIIGRFDPNAAYDGQMIKTLEIIRTLRERYGEDNVNAVSYHAVKENKPALLRTLFSAFASARRIVLCVRGAALPNLVRVCVAVNKIFRRPMFYVLIGGALADVTEQRPELLPLLDKMGGVFVETETVMQKLESQGVKRVFKLPNFKHLRLWTDVEQPVMQKPYKLIFMSRVAELKGVGEMVDAVKRINSDGVIYTLDIYGKPDPAYEERFCKMKESFPEYIRYMGVADPFETADIIHPCFAQLFPTKCPTEGQPASVIDSFFAGVPLIAARWNSCYDMIREGETGLTYTLNDFDEFERILRDAANYPERVISMRAACLEQAKKYLPEVAAQPLYQVIDESMKGSVK
ncbi:MAG: glycosyltransferase [Clostridia bacterium]|nr:glycosyltransferase [Clostridia bacterium]